jgi:hypothetical protein
LQQLLNENSNVPLRRWNLQVPRNDCSSKQIEKESNAAHAPGDPVFNPKFTIQARVAIHVTMHILIGSLNEEAGLFRGEFRPVGSLIFNWSTRFRGDVWSTRSLPKFRKLDRATIHLSPRSEHFFHCATEDFVRPLTDHKSPTHLLRRLKGKLANLPHK